MLKHLSNLEFGRYWGQQPTHEDSIHDHAAYKAWMDLEGIFDHSPFEDAYDIEVRPTKQTFDVQLHEHVLPPELQFQDSSTAKGKARLIAGIIAWNGFIYIRRLLTIDPEYFTRPIPAPARSSNMLSESDANRIQAVLALDQSELKHPHPAPTWETLRDLQRLTSVLTTWLFRRLANGRYIILIEWTNPLRQHERHQLLWEEDMEFAYWLRPVLLESRRECIYLSLTNPRAQLAQRILALETWIVNHTPFGVANDIEVRQADRTVDFQLPDQAIPPDLQFLDSSTAKGKARLIAGIIDWNGFIYVRRLLTIDPGYFNRPIPAPDCPNVSFEDSDADRIRSVLSVVDRSKSSRSSPALDDDILRDYLRLSSVIDTWLLRRLANGRYVILIRWTHPFLWCEKHQLLWEEGNEIAYWLRSVGSREECVYLSLTDPRAQLAQQFLALTKQIDDDPDYKR